MRRRRANRYQELLARYTKGVPVPLDELPEEFIEMNENPPESVLRVREEMKKKAVSDYPVLEFMSGLHDSLPSGMGWKASHVDNRQMWGPRSRAASGFHTLLLKGKEGSLRQTMFALKTLSKFLKSPIPEDIQVTSQGALAKFKPQGNNFSITPKILISCFTLPIQRVEFTISSVSFWKADWDDIRKHLHIEGVKGVPVFDVLLGKYFFTLPTPKRVLLSLEDVRALRSSSLDNIGGSGVIFVTFFPSKEILNAAGVSRLASGSTPYHPDYFSPEDYETIHGIASSLGCSDPDEVFQTVGGESLMLHPKGVNTKLLDTELENCFDYNCRYIEIVTKQFAVERIENWPKIRAILNKGAFWDIGDDVLPMQKGNMQYIVTLPGEFSLSLTKDKLRHLTDLGFFWVKSIGAISVGLPKTVRSLRMASRSKRASDMFDLADIAKSIPQTMKTLRSMAKLLKAPLPTELHTTIFGGIAVFQPKAKKYKISFGQVLLSMDFIVNARWVELNIQGVSFQDIGDWVKIRKYLGLQTSMVKGPIEKNGVFHVQLSRPESTRISEEDMGRLSETSLRFIVASDEIGVGLQTTKEIKELGF